MEEENATMEWLCLQSERIKQGIRNIKENIPETEQELICKSHRTLL